ncbi:MAG: glycosyltransferase family 32 protein, partial [Vicinamibacterales bacterium]
MIPRIIHQTWRTADVPPEWSRLAATWRNHHPDWELRLWTDADNERLVRDHYPELAAQYASCPYGIQRADFARYLILHRHGGVYVDLDMDCLRPVDSLLEGRTCVLTEEPAIHAAWIGRTRMVSNGFIAASPGHPFMERVLDLLKVRNLRITSHAEVLTSTGPVMLGEALASGNFDVQVLPRGAFSPLTSNDLELIQLHEGRNVEAIRARCRERGAWAIHYWANTWVRGLAGTLVNPDPDDVPGYVFHPGVDSPGFDLAHAGRDIPQVAALCDQQMAAVGFNTDGFLKSYIRPRTDW